ncbi:MAG: polysaccharide biosynthesis C-terminal domain-containing protein, partial [Clostridia bacterium]|nr:polysaccharide biosynthesis C-terminal domain-containing protein [Clostridia bacterium]
SIPMSLCALFSATTKTIDALTVVRILKGIIGEELAKTQYGILNGKVDTLVMLPFSFNIAFATALVPTISSAIAKKEMEIAKRRIKFSILVTILIGVPCSILMSSFSNEFLYLLFPKASLGSQMLKISSWTIIFVVLTQTINGALQGLGKVNVPVVAFAIGSIIKLIFNVLLIPKLKVNGAVYASIISSITIFLICYMELKKNINLKFNINKYLIKPIIASCIMFAFSYFINTNLKLVNSQNIRFIISLILGLIIYIISIICLKILSQEEIFMLPYGQLIYSKINNKQKAQTLVNKGIQRGQNRKD